MTPAETEKALCALFKMLRPHREEVICTHCTCGTDFVMGVVDEKEKGFILNRLCDFINDL